MSLQGNISVIHSVQSREQVSFVPDKETYDFSDLFLASNGLIVDYRYIEGPGVVLREEYSFPSLQ